MTPDKKRTIWKTIVATVAVLGVAGLGGAYLFMESGRYNVGTTSQHWQPVHTLLEHGLLKSVRYQARNIEAPSLTAPQMIASGAAVYRARCVQCHGAPGVAQDDLGKSMQPVPGPLVDVTQRWKARELYWITRHGISMTGMPAWEFHLRDDEIWSVVAFLMHMAALSPQDYASLARAEPVK